MKNCSKELKNNRGDTRLRLVLCTDASSRLPNFPSKKHGNCNTPGYEENFKKKRLIEIIYA